MSTSKSRSIARWARSRSQDQKAGAEYLKSLPFVDPKQIAIYGWSYGGYMTLKQLEADPAFYAAGIAGAPVTNWELYDTFYTERYMGRPQKDAAAYAKSDAWPTRARSPIRCCSSTACRTTTWSSRTASELIAKLQHDERPFEMMLYPGETHRSGGPETAARTAGTRSCASSTTMA